MHGYAGNNQYYFLCSTLYMIKCRTTRIATNRQTLDSVCCEEKEWFGLNMLIGRIFVDVGNPIIKQKCLSLCNLFTATSYLTDYYHSLLTGTAGAHNTGCMAL